MILITLVAVCSREDTATPDAKRLHWRNQSDFKIMGGTKPPAPKKLKETNTLILSNLFCCRCSCMRTNRKKQRLRRRPQPVYLSNMLKACLRFESLVSSSFPTHFWPTGSGSRSVQPGANCRGWRQRRILRRTHDNEHDRRFRGKSETP